MVDRNSEYYVKSTYENGWYREKRFLGKGPVVYERNVRVEGNSMEEVQRVLSEVKDLV